MRRRSFMKAAFLVFGLLAALSPAAAPAVDGPEDEFYCRIVRFSTFYLEGRNCERLVEALDALYEEAYNVDRQPVDLVSDSRRAGDAQYLQHERPGNQPAFPAENLRSSKVDRG